MRRGIGLERPKEEKGLEVGRAKSRRGRSRQDAKPISRVWKGERYKGGELDPSQLEADRGMPKDWKPEKRDRKKDVLGRKAPRPGGERRGVLSPEDHGVMLDGAARGISHSKRREAELHRVLTRDDSRKVRKLDSKRGKEKSKSLKWGSHRKQESWKRRPTSV